MSHEKWTVLFADIRTRTEVRDMLSTTLAGLSAADGGGPAFPAEISGLSTGNDREVMESYLRVKTFCGGRKSAERRASGAVGLDVRELFGKALERMKELPPEPIRLNPLLNATRQVRRA